MHHTSYVRPNPSQKRHLPNDTLSNNEFSSRKIATQKGPGKAIVTAHLAYKPTFPRPSSLDEASYASNSLARLWLLAVPDPEVTRLQVRYKLESPSRSYSEEREMSHRRVQRLTGGFDVKLEWIFDAISRAKSR